MIGRLSGILLEKNPPQILLDVQGVGYELDVPMSTFYNLPQLNEKVVLHTQFVVREDAQLLYGFLTHEERIAFRQLLKISGVGPKLALSVLSGLSLNDLAAAVANKEAGRLTKIPGVGKKTAERLLLELQGKFAVTGAASAHGTAAVSAAATSSTPCRRWLQRERGRLGGQAVAQGCDRVGRYPPSTQASIQIMKPLKLLSKA